MFEQKKTKKKRRKAENTKHEKTKKNTTSVPFSGSELTAKRDELMNALID
jgi:hypothetical protein